MTVEPNPIPCRRHPFCSRLISNNRVTAVDHWQDVRLVQFDIKGSGMRYSTLNTHNKIIDTNHFISKCRVLCSSHSTGDVLMVQPSNLADVVEEFFTFFALDPNQTFLLEQNDPGIFFANKVTTLIDVNVVVFVYSLNVIITVVIVVCD